MEKITEPTGGAMVIGETAPAFSANYNPINDPVNVANASTIVGYNAPNGPAQSTTTLSNANVINKVPNIIATTNKLSETGLKTDTQGNTLYPNGTVYNDPYKAYTSYLNTGGVMNMVDWEEKGRPNNDISNGDSSGDSYTTQIKSNLDKLQAQSDAVTADLIESIKANYESLRNQQLNINTRQAKGVSNALLMGGVTGGGGSSQYAPISSEGIIQSQLSYGLGKIAELNAKEQSAIATAKQAQLDNNFKLMDAQNALIQKIRDEKIETAKKQNELIIEQNAKVRENEIQSSIDNSIADLFSSGVTDPAQILKELSKSGLGVTAKQVKDTLENIATNSGATSIGALSGDAGIFYTLKNEGGLPADILALPSTGEQLLEFIKRKTSAETKAVSKSTTPTVNYTGKVEDTTQYQPLINQVANLESSVAGKKQVRDDMSTYIANGDYVSAYNQIANTVESYLTGTSKQRFSDSRTDYEVMQGMKNAIQEYANAGGDVGLLTGTEEQIKRKLGIDSGKATRLATNLWREFQAYRNTMTGAAFTEKESRDYASVNPTLSKSLDLNLNVINGALDQLKNRIQGTINSRIPDAQSLLEKAITGGAEDFINNGVPGSSESATDYWSKAK